MKSLSHRVNQKGAAAVEFAIVLPLLVLLVFGSIEFGLLLYNKQVITNAGREGARRAITGQNDAKQIVLDYCNRRPSDPADQKHKLIDLTRADGRYELKADDVTISGPDAQNDLTVTIKYDHNFAFVQLLGLVDTKINLSSSTVMRMEQ